MISIFTHFIITFIQLLISPESETMDINQIERLSDDQVENSTGGYVWKVDDMKRLRRFLCLGSDSGTYYIQKEALGVENAMCIERMVKMGKGKEVVKEIVEVSVRALAAKQNPIYFALALCAVNSDADTKKAAYEALSDVCRIPTHLFTFIEYVEKLAAGTGWGRAQRRAIGKWYNKYNTNPKKLAMHVTKYKKRNDWSHLDVFRLAHIKPETDAVALVARYIVKGIDVTKEEFSIKNEDKVIKETLEYLVAVEEVKNMKEMEENTLERLLSLIKLHRLAREHIPTGFLNSVQVWETLLKDMPMTALIRNLGKLSKIGLLSEGSEAEQSVAKQLLDEKMLKYSRVHPFNVLLALKTYEKGSGEKGSLSWPVNQAIVKALDDAFYKTFKFVEPTQKRFCLAVDVSGSMDYHGCCGAKQITAMCAAAAMMMVTKRTEKESEAVAFCDTLIPIDIPEEDSLNTVILKCLDMKFGSTDCAQPMIWAKAMEKKFDVFIVYTDSETYAGHVHPAEALRQYREWSGIWDAKLIVCGMTSNGFTIADPEDPGMLDIAGFDSSAPEAIRNFILGNI